MDSLYKTDVYHVHDILRQWYPWNYYMPETGWPEYVGVPEDWKERLDSSLKANPYFHPEADSRWSGADMETLEWALLQVGHPNPAPYGQIDQKFDYVETQYYAPPKGFFFYGEPTLLSKDWRNSFDLIALGYGPNSYGRITYHLDGLVGLHYKRKMYSVGFFPPLIVPLFLWCLIPPLMVAGGAIGCSLTPQQHPPGRRRRRNRP